MQLRTIAFICSIVGFLYSGFASALGLGEITLKSQFNQPLNAEIRLLKVRDLTEEEIIAELASREDFRRSGVDRVFFLTGLNFEVVLDNTSRPYIKVTSNKAVTEPYLNFLVEVQWPSGRLLREYTLLMDLPTFSSNPSPKPVVSAPSKARKQVVAPAPIQSAPSPVRQSSAPSSARTSSSSTRSNPQDSYKVRRGDTLWEIAESVRPDQSVSVHQTMIALQEANPDAFIGGNINRLRNGRVLRVPTAGEITDIAHVQAVSSVRQQYKSWSEKQRPQKAVLTSSSTAPAPTASSSEPQGRLTLGSADSGQGDVQSAGTSGEGQALRKELAAAEEELAKSKRQNSEYQSRIAELESQVETMEKLITATNQQLRELQIAIQNNKEAAETANVANNVEVTAIEIIEEQATTVEQQGATSDSELVGQDDTAIASTTPTGPEPSGVEPTTDTETASSTEEQVVAEQTEQANDAQETITAEDQPVAASDETIAVEDDKKEADVKPEPAVAEETGSSFDIVAFVKENLIMVAGGFLAFLILLFVLLKLREKPEEMDLGEFDMSDEVEDMFASDDADIEPVSNESEDFSVEDGFDDVEEVEAQTEDVVAEADIYVSLGQEEKAIELLQKEIHQNPDNADARLGLLKIYASAQDSAAFDEQYAQLLPLGNVHINDQAAALRKDIDNVSEFDTDQYEVELDSLDDDDSFASSDDDLDLDLDLEDEPMTEAPDLEEASLVVENESDLDLELGDVSLDLDEMGADTATAETTGAEIGDIEAELDLTADTELSFDELDDDLQLDIENEFSADISGDSLELHSSSADSELIVENALADLELDNIQDDLSGADGLAELDLDIDDDFANSLNLDDVGDDASSVLDDDDIIDELELEIDESADIALDADEIASVEDSLSAEGSSFAESSTREALSTDKNDLDLADDELDLDAPPSENIDLASLDQEIDAMTAELDDMLPSELSEDDSLDIVEPDFDVASLEADDDLELLATDEAGLDLDDEADLNVDSSVIDGVSTSALADDGNAISSSEDELALAEDDDLDFLEEFDEVSTKLDLAKAYLDMGDREGAEDILQEVIEEGNDDQKNEAQALMQQV